MLCMVMQKEQKSIDQKCKNCGYENNTIINPSVFRSSSPINNIEIKNEKPKEKYEYKFVDRYAKNSDGMTLIAIMSFIVQIVIFGAYLINFINSEYLLSLKILLSLFAVRAFMCMFTKEIVRVKV